MALSKGCVLVLPINGPLDCALVQGPPLQAIRYCTILCTETCGWIAGNWSYMWAREAIPQLQTPAELV